MLEYQCVEAIAPQMSQAALGARLTTAEGQSVGVHEGLRMQVRLALNTPGCFFKDERVCGMCFPLLTVVI